jgi:hypothetical protein
VAADVSDRPPDRLLRLRTEGLRTEGRLAGETAPGWTRRGTAGRG